MDDTIENLYNHILSHFTNEKQINCIFSKNHFCGSFHFFQCEIGASTLNYNILTSLDLIFLTKFTDL